MNPRQPWYLVVANGSLNRELDLTCDDNPEAFTTLDKAREWAEKEASHPETGIGFYIYRCEPELEVVVAPRVVRVEKL